MVRRLLAGLCLGLVSWQVAAAPAALGDCDGPLAQTLAPDAQALSASAYWLDRAHLQWPGVQAAQAHFALVHARAGGLGLHMGQAVSGADARLDLQVDTTPAVFERFKFVASGTRLRVREGDVVRLPELLKGELVLVALDDQEHLLAVTQAQTPGALDDWYAADTHAELGSRPARENTRFALWAPTAQAVALCRYASSQGGAIAIEPLKTQVGSGVWSASLTGNLSGQSYRYLVDVFVPGVGLVRNLVTDPYSISLNTDSQRSLVADLDAPALKPTGWGSQRPAAKAQTDMVVYELHVRDFSANDATVPAPHRGKYLAFTDGASNGMKHLKALAQAGVTDIHLLPVFDFATVPEANCKTATILKAPADSPDQQAAAMAVADKDCFNWGYDPWHYGAPEGSYASDADDGAVRIVEFRRMVQALHEAGLRVGMDVVYNHTTAAGQKPKSLLDRIVPGYYQRLDAQGQVEHSTCCDNTATEHAMMAKLMIDTAVRWVRDYGIDSLRFDLMAHQPRAAMESLQAAVDQARGGHVNLIGEGWNFGEIANGARFVQASQLSLNGSGIGTFSDRGRDAARGGSAGDSGAALIQNQGWLNGLVFAPNEQAPKRTESDLMAAADLLRVGLAGSLRSFEMPTWQGKTERLDQIRYGDQPAAYASEPSEVVNYVENHDNQTLFDINVLRLPEATSAEDRARVQVLGMALTAFSQGVAYFHAGIDLLRSKSLDRNSFDSGDWFNRIDWSEQDNGFASGLPPKGDNGADWPRLKPLLADPAIKPKPANIAWTAAAFRDLLRIRASTPLLHLPSAAEIKARLHFINAGAHQNPLVLAAVIDGQGYAGANFKRLAYFINTGTETQYLLVPEEKGQPYALHPVLARKEAADKSAKLAHFEPLTGLFSVPPRSAVVFVVP
ncbi:MAG TPA: alpha-1,6-glucosidase domain-containing protein [Burkholderiaceae bacterium]|jgi:pullulanase/glycogen debranching enzyme